MLEYTGQQGTERCTIRLVVEPTYGKVNALNGGTITQGRPAPGTVDPPQHVSKSQCIDMLST